MNNEWDCVVVGGGAAGLSAALVLGRARRRTLVVDAGEQSNLAAPGVMGFLGHDGQPPAQLYEAGRAELATYGSVEVRHGEVVTGSPERGGILLDLADGTRLSTRRVLLATGMNYRAPTVAGLAELWGRSAFHCPFCHGWELRDEPLAVLASGDRAVHMALMLRGWTDDVVVITNGPAGLGAAQRDQLGLAGVTVDEREVVEFVSDSGELASIRFAVGPPIARRGVLVAATLSQRSPLAARLGVAIAAPGPVVVDAVEIDSLHRTSVPGVFAAGDLSTQMPQVAAAVAAGSLAAAAIAQSLFADDYGLPVTPWPATKEHADAHA